MPAEPESKEGVVEGSGGLGFALRRIFFGGGLEILFGGEAVDDVAYVGGVGEAEGVESAGLGVDLLVVVDGLHGDGDHGSLGDVDV